MATEPSGLAWLCSARLARRPGWLWRPFSPTLARGRLSRRECLITMVRRADPGAVLPPSRAPSLESIVMQKRYGLPFLHGQRLAVRIGVAGN